MNDRHDDQYVADIDQVVAGLTARGRNQEATLWRAGSAEFLAGRTGCHRWHSAKQLLAEFEQE